MASIKQRLKRRVDSTFERRYFVQMTVKVIKNVNNWLGNILEGLQRAIDKTKAEEKTS